MVTRNKKTMTKTERQTERRTTDTSQSRTQRGAKANPVACYVRHLYGRSAPILIFEALLFTATALFMFFRPVATLAFITYLVGVGLILFGLWRTVAGFTATREAGGLIDVLFGLMSVILGVLFCVYPVGSVISLSYVFVILFFFNALRVLVFAINMARARFGHYVFNLILAILLVAVACVLFLFPIVTAVAVVYYLAIALLVYAVSDIYMFVEFTRLKRAVDA